jgi:hypothetical protein
MANISKHFKYDIASTNQKLSPVIIIADKNYSVDTPTSNIYYIFTENNDPLYFSNFTRSGYTEQNWLLDDIVEENRIGASGQINNVNCIEKVSNVKITNDYDSKKLKINRLRFNLYNYYDSETKLSEHITSDLTNKYVFLFYKSPTTKTIFWQKLFDSELAEYSSLLMGESDLPLLYRGEISRVKITNDKISITAEDRTQIKIANKKVPYTSTSLLSQEIQNNILESYKSDDAVVPMTFGEVSKAPVMPYLETNQRSMRILLDVFPTAGHFRTSKTPKMLESGHIMSYNNDYFLYILKDGDYLILDHFNQTIVSQNQLFSCFRITSQSMFQDNYILPEISYTNEEQNRLVNWNMRAFQQRLAESAFVSDGSILDVPYAQLHSLLDDEFENIEGLYNNNNYIKTFYKSSDSIQSSSNNAFVAPIRISHHPVNSDYTGNGKGRWIVLKMQSGVGLPLLNVYDDGNWIGTTFLASDIKMSQDLTNTGITPNDSITNPFYGDFTSLYITPVAEEVFGDLIPKILSTNTEEYDTYNAANPLRYNIHYCFKAIMATTNSDLEIVKTWTEHGGSGSEINTISPDFHGTFRLPHDQSSIEDDKYWGSRSDNNSLGGYQSVDGLYYGDKNYGLEGTSDVINANVHNYMAIFEFTPTNFDYDYMNGFMVNNFSLIHSVKVNNLAEEKIFASIVGRKNNWFTENLDPANAPEYNDFTDIDVTLDYFMQGSAGTLPDFELLIEKTFLVIEETFNSYFRSYPPDVNWEDFHIDQNGNESFHFIEVPRAINSDYSLTSKPEITQFIENFSEDILLFNFNRHITEDNNINSPIVNNFNFFKNVIWQFFISNAKLLNYMDCHASGVQYSNYEVTYFWDWILTKDYNSSWNLYQFFGNRTWVKTILKNIYEYVFQTNISTIDGTNPENWSVKQGWYDDCYATYNETYNWTRFHWQSSPNNAHWDTVDMNTTINAARQYTWNTLPSSINTVDDWRDNLYVYLDDLIQAVHTGICTEYQQIVNQNFWIVGTTNIDITFREPYEANLGNFATTNGWINGYEYTDSDNNLLFGFTNEIQYTAGLSIQNEEDVSFTTTGIIQKPSDIVMNILTNEMEFGRYDENQNAGNDVVLPDLKMYDLKSLNECRYSHDDWKMGFSVDKQVNGKKLIEEILKESKSYPIFTNEGKFGFINILSEYSPDIIKRIIDVKDIIKHNFTQTKREDIITSATMFYDYDHGTNNYTKKLTKSIEQLLPQYTNVGLDYYNLDPIDGHKDINLKYHTDAATVEKFMDFTLLNSCNSHSVVELTLPLSYLDLAVSDIIHIPLINNEKIFNLNYSVVDYKNGQAIYPLWLILETNISTTNVKVKAYQLHYLAEGEPTFDFSVLDTDTEGYTSSSKIGNMNEFNTRLTFTNGEPIPNYNYDPNAEIHSGVEIPYFSTLLQTKIFITDVQKVVAVIGSGVNTFTDVELEILKYNADGTLNTDIFSENTITEITDIFMHNLNAFDD